MSTVKREPATDRWHTYYLCAFAVSCVGLGICIGLLIASFR